MMNQRPNCKFYGSMKGCQNGNNCQYNHLNPNCVPLCHYYNNCRYGNNCKFRHFNYNDYSNHNNHNNYTINNNAYNTQYIQYQTQSLHSTINNSNNNPYSFNQLPTDTMMQTQIEKNINYKQIQTTQNQPANNNIDTVVDDHTIHHKSNTVISDNKNENIDKIPRSTMLLNGYIRKIQTLFQQQLIIPNEIYSLCYLYYLHDPTSASIIIFCGLNVPLHHLCTKEYLSFFDINNKSVSFIQANKLKKKMGDPVISPLCHIQNISYLLPNDMKTNSELDAIFAVYHATVPPYRMQTCLLLYQPSNVDDKNNVIVPKYEIESDKQPMNALDSKQFVYCHDENIILYRNAQNAKFYGLELKHIIQKKEFTNFKEMKELKQINNALCSYVNMTYLTNKRSIFAIENKRSIFFPRDYAVKCGIFSLGNNTWIDIKPYRMPRCIDVEGNNISTCYDNNDNIYVLNEDDVSKFDCIKNEWNRYNIGNTMMYDSEYIGSKKSWMNNNIIYDLRYYIKGQFWMYSLDLRGSEKTRTWMANNVQFHGLNEDQYDGLNHDNGVRVKFV